MLRSTGSGDAANVTTGVALVKVTDEISFYFGCVVSVAQARGLGGAGLFVGSRDDTSVRRVYQLHGGNDSTSVEPVRAGVMFIADSDMCDVAAIWQKITGSNAVCLVSPHWSAIAATSLLLLLTTSMKSC